MSTYFLATERLGFRAWRDADIDLASALWSDPAVARFISQTGAFSTLDVKTRFAAEIAMDRAHGVQYWPVFLLADGAHAGVCGLRPYGAERGVFELGVHLRPAFWGRGLAVEGARAVIAHAFDARGAAWLFAGHHPDNVASRAMLAKLGFRYTHGELYAPTGREHPSYRLDRPSSAA